MLNFSEQNIFIFLLQLFILLGLARVLGEIFQKMEAARRLPRKL